MCAAGTWLGRSPSSADRLTDESDETLSTTFRDLGVHPDIATALERGGIVSPFPIQEMTLSVALQGADLIGQARTGTGKTLAFGIPVLQRSVAPHDPDYAQLCALLEDFLEDLARNKLPSVASAMGLDLEQDAFGAGVLALIGPIDALRIAFCVDSDHRLFVGEENPVAVFFGKLFPGNVYIIPHCG